MSMVRSVVGVVLAIGWIAAPVAQEPKAADPVHGLVELAKRTRIKPHKLLADSGDERVVFKDTATGMTVWKMSRNPGSNRHVYSNIPVWNRDGSELLLSSTRPGGAGSWSVASDGSRWRYCDWGNAVWSGLDPHTVFFLQNSTPPKLFAVDVRTGQHREVWKPPFARGSLTPPSADGKKLLLVSDTQSKTAVTSFAYLINADGSGEPQKFDLEGVVHQIWFLKRPDYSFMFNHEPQPPRKWKEGQYLCEPAKGGRVEQLSPDHFSHAGVCPDGSSVAHFRGQGISIFDLETRKNRELTRTNGSGHLSWQSDTGWFVASLGNTVSLVNVDPPRVEVLGVPNTWIEYATANTSTTPELSPDGTKVGYASSMLGDADFYVLVRQRPDGPREVKRDGEMLTWQPPAHSREIAGYHVYRDGKALTREPVRETRFKLPDARGDLVVTAIEACGLESKRADATPPKAPGGLAAKAVDGYAVQVSWDPPPDGDIAYYNVYAGIEEVKAEQAWRIASPVKPATIDWGLRAGKRYRYVVTAVDRAGNESAPSSSVTATTPRIQLSQQTVAVKKNLGEKPIEIAFELPRADTYVVWVRLKPAGVSINSTVGVSLDGERERSWKPTWDFVCKGIVPEAVWFWDTVAGPESCSPVFTLTAGSHKLVLQSRDKAEIDCVVVTNDRGFVPEGITSFQLKR